ncbi:MAG: thiamine pyrophosphate-binding protein [Alphaproteobacteria bacterium]
MTNERGVSMKLHAALAKSLFDNGVGTMFGLIGDGNLFVVQSYVDDLGGTFVSAANEAGATVMAIGYSVVSGEIGVVTVTHGPGVANTLTGLIEGVRAQVPMLLVCGDTAIADKHGLQNVSQRELIVATGAGFEQVRAPQTVFEDLRTAFRRARAERRPIALNVPADFMWLDVDYEEIDTRAFDNRAVVPESHDLDDAIGILAAAKMPVILAGRGAIETRQKDALIKLADRTDALLATTLKAKGLFRGHDFDLGVFGTLSTPIATDLIMRSDCVVAFGASLNQYTTATGSLLKDKRVIQCNLNREDIGRFSQPTAGVVGDPGLTADLFVRWLDEAEIPGSGFRSKEISDQIQDYSLARDLTDKATATTVDITKSLLRLNDAVPKNRLYATDVGRYVMQAWKVFDVPDPRSLLFTVHFGSIGLGMPYAIGASFAAPGRPALLVTGDGGFMLGGLTEFNTAVRHNVDLIVVVCNDGSYGAEHIQFRNRNLSPDISCFDWPEFAPLADALGGQGLSVRNQGELEAACAAIEKRTRPLLIDLKLDPDHVPSMRH